MSTPSRPDRSPQPAADPRPVRPAEPDPGDCCGEGCVSCVYDVYEHALARYQDALEAWLKRHPEAPPTAP